MGLGQKGQPCFPQHLITNVSENSTDFFFSGVCVCVRVCVCVCVCVINLFIFTCPCLSHMGPGFLVSSERQDTESTTETKERGGGEKGPGVEVAAYHS